MRAAVTSLTYDVVTLTIPVLRILLELRVRKLNVLCPLLRNDKQAVELCLLCGIYEHDRRSGTDRFSAAGGQESQMSFLTEITN